MEYPICPFLKNYKQQKICELLSNRSGGLIKSIPPHQCQIGCKNKGPYPGKEITEEKIGLYCASSFANKFNLTSRVPSQNNLLYKVVKRYQSEMDILFPTDIYNLIKTALKDISPRIEKIYLTGSILSKKNNHKDYDIIIKIDDWERVDELEKLLPTTINGVTCDYFFTTLDTPNVVMFVILDPETKILYTSNWYELKIKSIDSNITIKVTPPNKLVDDYMKNILFTYKNRIANENGAVASDVTHNIKSQRASLGWGLVSDTWKRAESFLTSASSRGLAPTLLDKINIQNEFGERVSDKILKERQISCLGNSTSPACFSVFKDGDGNSYCSACGCGAKKMTRLNARDDSEYTKLHYPKLACPLKRRGFSNYEVPLSIIIPVLNDLEEVNLTIKSIRNTTGYDVEVIVIDDASDLPIVLEDDSSILIRWDIRRGAGEARHYGATIAKSKNLLFIDSHMRFKKGWIDTVMDNMDKNPKTLWCGICLGLNNDNMDVNNPIGEYTGASLCLYNNKTEQTYEGIWQSLQNQIGNYEIPCIMGACYFIKKEWFFFIRGLETNRMWGYEEPFLSIKTWLAGGNVQLMRDVKIGHKFRDSAPYVTDVSKIIYNKIRYMYLTLPEDIYNNLLDKIPNDNNKSDALIQIQKDMPKITEEREYYKKIFIHDIHWLCEKFKIEIPK